jgi:hypothetical protein
MREKGLRGHVTQNLAADSAAGVSTIKEER